MEEVAMSRSSSKSSLKEEEDWDELTSGATRRAMTDQVVVDLLFDSSVDGPGEFIDHRTLPRRERKKYDHARAKECIMSDYLGLAPLFNDRQFQVFFRISRSRMQCFIEDFGGTGDKYYCGKGGSCLEARILLPLKTLAYGVPPHTFCDYFQMSFQFARDCCDKFDSTLSAIYKAEYLRLPTRSDVKNITKLMRQIHLDASS